MITKTDLNRTVLISKFIDTGFFDHRIINTVDSGLMLAARKDSNLYIIKFNSSLTQQRSQRFPLGYSSTLSERFSVAIERQYVDTNDTEYFYVTTIAPTSITGYKTKEIAFKVLKIASNGILSWNNKYVDAGRASYSTGSVYDWVHAIQATSLNKSTFCVVGTRWESDHGHENQYLFYINIDQTGAII
ncbi:MAG: hypothetical protein EOP48_33950, partial [Sphingobacteriales bacterium]